MGGGFSLYFKILYSLTCLRISCCDQVVAGYQYKFSLVLRHRTVNPDGSCKMETGRLEKNCRVFITSLDRDQGIFKIDWGKTRCINSANPSDYHAGEQEFAEHRI